MFLEIAKSYFWVPFLIVLSLFGAYASKKYNDVGGLWMYVTVFSGILLTVVWTTISKLSTNMIFDCLLYDIIISVCYMAGFIYLGCGAKFGAFQWAGAGMALVGFILMKVKG